ncbi:Clavaminate synthase-like protein [Calocera viscosa TUFC12733]|uniref:Clavaminate synthase-like protein n=1 Tax=Calocera viscosa (strain TUFC12733) TaxID=1330018 RepID=A0A167J2N0_CALVF|nr:Clavaminate synthase-like protein [Calocera viscosa TUFC12733]
MVVWPSAPFTNLVLRCTRLTISSDMALCLWRQTRTLSRNDVKSDVSFRIPLVDFSRYRNAASHSEKQQTADDIVNAFREVGFVYLMNHGVTDGMLENVFGQVKEFFRMPVQKKDQLAWEDPRANRGYVRQGRERVTQSTSVEEIAALRLTAPDSKESMEIGRDWDSVWKNQWPKEEDVPGFRSTILDFFEACHDTHTVIMRSIALGLRLDETFFDDKINEQWHNLRLLSYPPLDADLLRKDGQARAGAHSDYGTLTLLFQDAVGGLEVQNPHTMHFHPATPIPGTVVVNVGDLLSRWSNDTLRSTLHRVVAPPSYMKTATSATGEQKQVEIIPERKSIAFFCNPNFGAVVECLPTCVGSEGPKYEPVQTEKYIVGRLSDTYF